MLVYGLSHAAVDGVCAAVIFTVFRNQIATTDLFIGLVVLYNALAFGLEALFGLFTDYFKSPRAAAFSGCIVTGLSAVFLPVPIVAVVLAGLGNALFHVGGGSISLNLTPKKAFAPGIFVAPGAIGILLGTVLGRSGQFAVLPSIIILTILCVSMFVINKPEMNYFRENISKQKSYYFELILLLLLLSIAIRALVGSVLVFPWKVDMNLVVVLTGAVVLGKALGGVLADRFGWIKVAVGALVLSIPFLVFGARAPFSAIIGMFLFNITMPVTLVAISNIMPGRPGFTFGLTTLALIIGATPAFLPIKQMFGSDWFVFCIIIISTLALFLGLKKYAENYEQKTAVD